jgi:hypothetical protein
MKLHAIKLLTVWHAPALLAFTCAALNLSMDTGSCDLMAFCHERGVMYLDTVAEPCSVATSTARHPSGQTTPPPPPTHMHAHCGVSVTRLHWTAIQQTQPKTDHTCTMGVAWRGWQLGDVRHRRSPPAEPTKGWSRTTSSRRCSTLPRTPGWRLQNPLPKPSEMLASAPSTLPSETPRCAPALLRSRASL